MTVPVLDAATVIVVRDGVDGPEVLMLRRRLESDFVGGAYVFPGGAVDPGDRDAALSRSCSGRSDADASSRLGLAAGGLAFWVAAVRETFEESGLLLAQPASAVGASPVSPVPAPRARTRPDPADLLTLHDPAVADRFSAYRSEIEGGRRTMAELCHREGLALAVDRLHYFSHWITPEGAPRRYDTRFFIAEAPPAQESSHDGSETVEDLWIRPADALAAHDAERFPLILPTHRSLVALSRFASSADAVAAAATLESDAGPSPMVAEPGGGLRIPLPGDRPAAPALAAGEAR